MKTYIILIFSIFHFWTLSNAQNVDLNKSITITDSTLILGILNESSYVGELNLTDCYLNSNKFLEVNSRVLICGAKRCKNINSETTSDYYQIVYKETIYYIEFDKVTFPNFNFQTILNLDDNKQNKLKEYAIKHSKIFDLMLLDNAFNNLKSFKKFGLGIYDWGLYDESEYTDGTSINIKVYNPTKKTIKYIWFSFIGLNPVDDKIIDPVTRKSIITKKAVGPILSEEFASYKFDYVWFTDLVETSKIFIIKIQYMDGSFITIKNPKAIILNSEDKNILDDYFNEN